MAAANSASAPGIIEFMQTFDEIYLYSEIVYFNPQPLEIRGNWSKLQMHPGPRHLQGIGNPTGNGDIVIEQLRFFEANHAGFGAVYLDRAGQITFKSTWFDNNHSGALGGALVIDRGDVRLENSYIAFNSSTDGAGAIGQYGGNLATVDSQVYGNQSLTGGAGAIGQYGGNLEVVDSQVNGNQSLAGSGGAIRNYGSGSLTITNTNINDNTAAGTGGGIYLEGGSLTVSGNYTWQGNRALGTTGHSGGGALAIVVSPQLGPISIEGTYFGYNETGGAWRRDLVEEHRCPSVEC